MECECVIVITRLYVYTVERVSNTPHTLYEHTAQSYDATFLYTLVNVIWYHSIAS